MIEKDSRDIFAHEPERMYIAYFYFSMDDTNIKKWLLNFSNNDLYSFLTQGVLGKKFFHQRFAMLQHTNLYISLYHSKSRVTERKIEED